MRKVSVLILILLITGCAEFNDAKTPCGLYGENCITRTPINQ